VLLGFSPFKNHILFHYIIEGCGYGTKVGHKSSIQKQKKKYYEKLSKTIEKQEEWQLSKTEFLQLLKLTHLICLMTPIDGHLILEDEHSFQTKNKAVVEDQPCRSEDKTSQEGGDDGNHPATYIL